MSILFIGLGAMGEPMARRLAAVTDVVIHDVDVARAERLGAEWGVSVLADLDELPADVETIVLMVPNSRIVESILRGDRLLLDRMPAGGLVIDMSSSEPESTRMLAVHAASMGIGYVDAPVSGGVARAATGELAIMAGGTPDDVERALPVLRAIGVSIHHVGGSGAGDAAKALNNLLSATNIAAAAEVLTAAAAFGIAPEAMLAVINASTGRSQATEVKYPQFVLSGSFASGFGLDLMLKDLAIARGLTGGAGLTTPVTDAAALAAHASREFAATPPDHTEIVRYYEAANGTLIRQSPREENDDD